MKLLVALACLAVSNGQMMMNNWAGYGYNAWNPYGMNMATTYAAAPAAPMMAGMSGWGTMAAPMSMMGSPAGHAFSYNDGWSTRSESSLLGATTGSYSYVDSNGQLQTVNYKADAGGFRAEGTNLPVMKMAAPMPVDDTPEVKAAKAEFMAKFKMAEMGAPAAPVMKMAAPAPVQDTPEVAAAKAEFMAKFREAEMKSRRRRSLVVGLSHTPASTAPLLSAPILASPLTAAYWATI